MNNSFIFDNPKAILIAKTIMCVLIANIILTLVLYREDQQTVPNVSRGNYAVFYEELGSNAFITDICTTNDYIYFAYSSHCAIQVYNWNGLYIQSMAFHKPQNGGFDIRCENELLYVDDHQINEFIFSGTTLLEVSDNIHAHAWYYHAPEPPLVIKSGIIYDKSGNMIMELPGQFSK